MKQIFLLEDGILTYLAFAATADGKKVYVADSVFSKQPKNHKHLKLF